MKNVIFGHVCIDKNTSEHTSYIAAGSPAMFIQRIFAQFPKCTTTIIAPYGKDFLPYSKNINLFPAKPNSKKTLVYENISKNGKRIQRAYNRANAQPIKIDDNIKNILSQSDIVFIAPLLPNLSKKYFSKIKSSVRKKSLIVLLPQGFYRNFDKQDNVIVREFKEADEVLQYVDIVIVSDQDCPKMISVCKKWSKNNQNLITVVTRGKKGVTIIKNNKKLNVPSLPVAEKDVVDSVGAGDTFSAAFAYQFKKTDNIFEAGKFANSIARQKLFFKLNDLKISF